MVLCKEILSDDAEFVVAPVGNAEGLIGHGLNSPTLKHAAVVAAYIVPFEALYQDALHEITATTTGLTGFLLELGPFGGAFIHGTSVRLWACAYIAVVAVVAALAFSRRDL